MQSLMRHEGYIYVHWKNLAKYSVEIADYLLADLDATAVSNEPQTPQPDADGWIPHRPGDPMPCGGDMSIVVKHGDGVTTNPEKARFWDGSDDDINCWTGKGCEKPTWAIVAWKPA